MTYSEYCAFERESTVKHEYLRGEVMIEPLAVELDVDEVYRDPTAG